VKYLDIQAEIDFSIFFKPLGAYWISPSHVDISLTPPYVLDAI
jgi:hypothetical protein